MRDTFKDYGKNRIDKQKKRKAVKVITAISALLVAGVVMWQMMLPGIAMQSVPHCGIEEHTHSDACYTKQLTCGQEETDGHTHTDACYHTERVLSCGQEESESHQHTDACYTEQRTLICGQQEKAAHHHTSACYTKTLTCGKEEHTHTDICYSDPTADVENENTWKRIFANVQLGDDWGDNVAAIAKTQVGYKESEKNYNVVENNEHKGYTRYGNWAGAEYIYGNWDTTFAEFCIHYAEVPDTALPMNADINEWIQALQENDLYVGADSGDYQPGDLIFLQKKDQETEKQVGIIEKVEDKNGKTYITVIEGNCENQVKRSEYATDDENILGYGLICKAQMKYKVAQMREEENQTAEADTADTQQDIQAQEEENAGQAVFYSDGADGNAVAAQSESKIDITNDKYTSVTIKQTSVEVGETVAGTMKFRVDLSKVDIDENTIIEYKLPDGLTFKEGMTGELTGNIKGTYAITTDGKIQIKISKESLDAHQGGVLDGGVSFKATVSKYPESGEIEFPGNNTNIQIKRDMSVQKSNGTKNEDGTWHYSVNVSTKSGTPDKITLEDVANLNDSNAKCEYRNIVIKDKNGNQIATADKFPINLDKLKAGEEYHVEYDIAVTDYGINANGIKISNQIKATTGTGENKIEKTDKKDTTVADAKLQKWGWYDKNNKEIVWTITVNNPGKEDLSKNGDLIDTPEINTGSYKEGSIEVKDKNGTVINGNVTKKGEGFQYQFPQGSTSEKYTITYRTTVKDGFEGTVSNHVEYDGTKKDGTVDTGKLGDWNVEKSNNNYLEAVDDNTKKLKWTVVLTLSEKENTKEIVYTDKIIDTVDSDGKSYNDSHYTTIEELKESIKNMLIRDRDWSENIGQSDAYNVSIQYFSDEGMNIPISDTENKSTKVKSYRLTITRKDGKEIKGNRIEFNYYTFVDSSQLINLDQWTITNKGYFQNKESSKDYTYKTDKPKPSTAFIKERVKVNNVWDWNNANATTATGDVNLQETNGILYYRIILKATDTQFPCTITDTLGKGMKLKTDANGKPDWKIAFCNPENASYEYSTANNPEQYVTYQKMSSDGDNEVWQFTVDNYRGENFDKSKDGIEIIYKVDITDHDIWTNATTEESTEENNTKYSHVFTNKATWNDQEQKTDTKLYQVVKDCQKEGECVTSGDEAYMPKYSVVINANGKDLNEDGDTIQLEDTLSLSDQWDADKTYSYLNLNEVKLYYYDWMTGQKGDEIDSSRYNVKYDQVSHKITAIVPDQLPCVLEYSYKLDSNFQKQITLSNNVSFKNKTVASKSFVIDESQAFVRGKSFYVQKIDSDQNSKTLSGAQFKIYYYDKGTNQFVQITDASDNGVYTTDENGKLNLTQALYPITGDRTDVLLMLVETAAPQGYKLNEEPSYFVLEKESTVDKTYEALANNYKQETWTLADLNRSFSKIDKSKITAFSQYGGDLYVTNTSNQITVKKVWVDASGKELSNPPDNITFKLNKTSTDLVQLKLKVNRWSDYTLVGEYSVKKGTNVTLKFETGEWQQTSNVSAILDGKNVSIQKQDKGNQQYSYEVNFNVPNNKKEITLILDANGTGGSGLSTQLDSYNIQKENPVGESTIQEEVTISSSNNWTYRTNAEENAKYTVSEVKVNGKPLDESNYTVSYYNNDGIDHGEIVITNKQKEQQYELPSTGGVGTTGYLAGGAALMCLAALLYGYQMRRKRERGTM